MDELIESHIGLLISAAMTCRDLTNFKQIKPLLFRSCSARCRAGCRRTG